MSKILLNSEIAQQHFKGQGLELQKEGGKCQIPPEGQAACFLNHRISKR